MIDATVLFGAPRAGGPAAAYGLEAARAELAGHGMAAALVCARSGTQYRHEMGNAETFAAATTSGPVRLHPVATINPVQYLGWRHEVDRALASGAVAFRFFPEEQSWEPESAAFQEVAARVAHAGRPLLIPVGRFGSATAVGAATAKLEVPVVLVGGHYTQLGDCLAALAKWPHLHLDTSRLAQFRGVETVVQEVGAERLVFGSGAPVRPVQAALNAVLVARIPDDAKRLILAGNAERLFGLPARTFDLPEPTGATGLIDVHGHVGSLPFATPAVDPEELVRIAASHGIARTVASSSRAIVDDVAAGNREAFSAAREVAGGGLLAYVVVDPNDLAGSREAMDAAYASGAAIGAKLHCEWSGQPTASPATRALLAEVARRGRPLLIHCAGPGWEDVVVEVAGAHPRWKVIVAHGGPGIPSRAGASAVERAENVYLELATSHPDLPVVREVVRRVGPDRLLFGSDAPLIDQAYGLGLYADAGAALGRTTANARDVFGL